MKRFITFRVTALATLSAGVIAAVILGWHQYPRAARSYARSKLHAQGWGIQSADDDGYELVADDESDDVTSPDLSYVGMIHDLSYLDLSEYPIDGIDLGQLSELTKLKCLSLGPGKIEEKHLKALRPLKSLESLRLTNTEVTSVGLRYLECLPELESLVLRGSPIDDAGLVAISQLSELTFLDLSKTNITNDGLRYLIILPRLAILRLSDTRINEQAIETLVKMPDVLFITGNTGITRDHIMKLTESGFSVKSDLWGDDPFEFGWSVTPRHSIREIKKEAPIDKTPIEEFVGKGLAEYRETDEPPEPVSTGVFTPKIPE